MFKFVINERLKMNFVNIVLFVLFWRKVKNVYFEFVEVILKFIFLFMLRYFCEIRFFIGNVIEIKYRNIFIIRNVIVDLIILVKLISKKYVYLLYLKKFKI